MGGLKLGRESLLVKEAQAARTAQRRGCHGEHCRGCGDGRWGRRPAPAMPRRPVCAVAPEGRRCSKTVLQGPGL